VRAGLFLIDLICYQAAMMTQTFSALAIGLIERLIIGPASA
jgi:hypothetical protein